MKKIPSSKKYVALFIVAVILIAIVPIQSVARETEIAKTEPLLFPYAVISSPADEMEDQALVNILETILYKNADAIFHGWFLSGSGLDLDENSILNPEMVNPAYPPDAVRPDSPIIYEVTNMKSIAEAKANLEVVFSSRLLNSYIYPFYLEGYGAIFTEENGKLYYTAARIGGSAYYADFSRASVIRKNANAFEIEVPMITQYDREGELFVYEIVRQSENWALDNFYSFYRDNHRIRVILDGQELVFDQPPIIESGRTLVPFRVIFEALGAKVSWDQETRTVTATEGATTVIAQIDNHDLIVNGMTIPLDVPPRIVNSHTLVPTRAVAASFGADVTWDASSSAKKCVIIDSGEAENHGDLSHYINNRKVNSVQLYYKRTMGGVRYECKTNKLIKELHQFLIDNTSDEGTAPENFNISNTPDSYCMSSDISFMETVGLDGTTIHRYTVYVWLGSGLSPQSRWLIHAVTQDKWYQIDNDDFGADLQKVYDTGAWEEIFGDYV